jgi:hypothetical protein
MVINILIKSIASPTGGTRGLSAIANPPGNGQSLLFAMWTATGRGQSSDSMPNPTAPTDAAAKSPWPILSTNISPESPCAGSALPRTSFTPSPIPHRKDPQSGQPGSPHHRRQIPHLGRRRCRRFLMPARSSSSATPPENSALTEVASQTPPSRKTTAK